MIEQKYNICTPQEKLKKISLDASNLYQFLNNTPQLQQQNLEGWQNHKWDLKNSTFNYNNTQKKSIFTNNKNKIIFPSENSFSQLNCVGNKAKYIQKLQEKLIQLINLKKNSQKQKQQNSHLIYTTPQKNINIGQKTASTSSSEEQKKGYNFITFSKKKQMNKNLSFKIRKNSREFRKQSSIIKLNEFNREIIENNSRANTSRSNINDYQSLNQRIKQILPISYPIIDLDRKSKRHNKPTNFQKLSHSFYFKSALQYSKRLPKPEKLITDQLYQIKSNIKEETSNHTNKKPKY